MRGRITVYCVAESIDRKALELRLRERGGSFLLHQYPDVLYGLFESSKVRQGQQGGAVQGGSGEGGAVQGREGRLSSLPPATAPQPTHLSGTCPHVTLLMHRLTALYRPCCTA